MLGANGSALQNHSERLIGYNASTGVIRDREGGRVVGTVLATWP